MLWIKAFVNLAKGFFYMCVWLIFWSMIDPNKMAALNADSHGLGRPALLIMGYILAASYIVRAAVIAINLIRNPVSDSEIELEASKNES